MNIYKKKYRIFSLFSCVILCAIFLCGSLLTSLVFASDTYWSNNQEEILKGSGSASDPYQISNAGQLYYFIYSAPNQYANIITDIDCSAHTWDGKTITKSFTLNGNGRGISNIYYKGGSYGGLVGQNTNAYSVMTFKNLSVSTTNGTVADKWGTLVGVSSGTITLEKCIASGDVYGTSASGARGGFVGSSSVINITQCFNYVNIKGNTSSGSIGGFCSTANYVGQVELCGNYGNLSGYCVGGIIGQINGYNDCNISKCFNNGSINATSRGGGLFGQIYGDFNADSSYNMGDVTGDEVAAFAGYVGDEATIKNSYNAGTVDATNNDPYVYSTIEEWNAVNYVTYFQIYGALADYMDTGGGEVATSSQLLLSVGNITYQSQIKDLSFVNVSKGNVAINNSYSIKPDQDGISFEDRKITFSMETRNSNNEQGKLKENCEINYDINNLPESVWNTKDFPYTAYMFDNFSISHSPDYINTTADCYAYLLNRPQDMNIFGYKYGEYEDKTPINAYLLGIYCEFYNNKLCFCPLLCVNYNQLDNSGHYQYYTYGFVPYVDYGAYEITLPKLSTPQYYEINYIKNQDFGSAFEKDSTINNGYPYLKDIYWSNVVK